QVSHSIDAEGFVTEYVRDIEGNALEEIRYAQALTTEQITSLDLSSLAIQTDKFVTSKVFDSLNRLIETTSHDAVVTQFNYDVFGQIIEQRIKGAEENHEDARVSQYSYDLLGRQINSLTAADIVTDTQIGDHYAFDNLGRLVSLTNRLGHTSYYYYDDNNRLLFTVDAEGVVVASEYNDFGDKTKETQLSNKVSNLSDLQGGVITAELTDQLTYSVDNDFSTQWLHNKLGLQTKQTDVLGYEVDYSYNAFGEVSQEVRQIERENNQATKSVTTDYLYNRLGLESVRTQDTAGIGLVRQQQYDAFGRLSVVIESGDVISRTQYDRNGRTIAQVDGEGGIKGSTYDALGRLFTTISAFGEVTQYQYLDSLNGLKITTPEGIQTYSYQNAHGEVIELVDGLGQSTIYQYDKNGNIVSEINSKGEELTYTLDHDQFLINTLDASGKKVIFSYDKMGRLLTRTIDPDGLKQLTSYSYDERGQQVSVIENGLETITRYDLAGNVLLHVVDPNDIAQATKYTLDGLGNKLTKVQGKWLGDEDVDPINVQSFQYDRLGRLVDEINDPDGAAVQTVYRYDGHGNVEGVRIGNQAEHTREYDLNGRQESRLDGEGFKYSNEYDLSGNLISETKSLAGSETIISITSYKYDKDNRLTTIVDSESIETRLVLDANGNIVNEIVQGGVDLEKIYSKVPDSFNLKNPNAENLQFFWEEEIGDLRSNIRHADGSIVGHAYEGSSYFSGGESQVNSFTQRINLMEQIPLDITERSYLDLDLNLEWMQSSYEGVDKAGMGLVFYDQSMRVVDGIQSELISTGELLSSNTWTQRSLLASIPKDAMYLDILMTVERVSPNDSFADGYIDDIKLNVSYAYSVFDDADQYRQNTRRVYDEFNREIFRVDNAGYVTENIYDIAGNLIRTHEYSQSVSLPFSASEQAVRQVLSPNYDNDRTTYMVYDLLGRKTDEVNAEGFVTQWQYDVIGNISNQISYATPIAISGQPTQASIALSLNNNEISGTGFNTASTETIESNNLYPLGSAVAGTPLVSQTDFILNNSFEVDSDNLIRPYPLSDEIYSVQTNKFDEVLQLTIDNPNKRPLYLMDGNLTIPDISDDIAIVGASNTFELSADVNGLYLDASKIDQGEGEVTSVVAQVYFIDAEGSSSLVETTSTNLSKSVDLYEYVVPEVDPEADPPESTDPVPVFVETREFSATSWNGNANLIGDVANFDEGSYVAVVTVTTDQGETRNEVEFTYGEASYIQPLVMSWASNLDGMTANTNFSYIDINGEEQSVLIQQDFDDDAAPYFVKFSASDFNWGLASSEAAGNYVIEYKNDYGDVIRSITGSLKTAALNHLNSIQGDTHFEGNTFVAGSGQSLDRYISQADIINIDYVEANVYDLQGNLLSSQQTDPRSLYISNKNYVGAINLSSQALTSIPGGETGQYKISVSTYYLNGEDTSVEFSYQLLNEDSKQQVLSFSNTIFKNAPDYLEFEYKAAAENEYQSQKVLATQSGYEINFGELLTQGSYDYRLKTFNEFGAEIGSSNGTFIGMEGQTQSNNQVASMQRTHLTASTGQSLTGYLTDNLAKKIAYVTATTTNLNTLEALATETTYIEYDLITSGTYHGSVNISKQDLTDGLYSVNLELHYLDGSSELRQVTHQVGQVSSDVNLTNVSFDPINLLPNSHLEAVYKLGEQWVSGSVIANSNIQFKDLGEGSHDVKLMAVQNNIAESVVKSWHGQVEIDALGNAVLSLNLNSDLLSQGSSQETQNYYDALGNLIYQIDPLGRVIANSYDTMSRLVTSERFTETVNTVPTMTLVDLELFIENLTDEDKADNRITDYVYDGMNNVELESLRNTDQSIARTYNKQNLLASETNSAGVTTHYSYNDNGQLYRAFKPVERVLPESNLFFAEGYAAHIAEETELKGYLTEYEYDVFGNVSKEVHFNSLMVNPGKEDVSSEKQETSYIYNGRNLLTEKQDGAFTTQYRYDTYKNLNVLIEDADSEFERITTFKYNGINQLVEKSLGGNVSEMQYDAFGNVISETSEEAFSLINSDSSWAQTQRGLLGYASLVENLSNTDKVELKDLYTTRSERDLSGTLHSQIDGIGRIVSTKTDVFGQIIEFTDKTGLIQFNFYDNQGNLRIKVGSGGNVESYVYDFYGNKTSETIFSSPVNFELITSDLAWSDVYAMVGVDDLDSTTVWEYDALGRVLQVDANGRIEIYSYDAMGNRLSKTDAKGNITWYLYDANNRLIGERLPLVDVSNDGVDVADQRLFFEYAYDSAGRRTESGLVGKSENDLKEYDILGNLVMNSTMDGKKIFLEYNSRGDVLAESNGNGFVTRYSYNESGYLSSKMDSSGFVTNYSQDPAGNVIGEYAITGGQVDRGLESHFDRDGNLLFQTILGNQTVFDTRSGIQTTSSVNGFKYNSAGKLAFEIDANGNRSDFIYDKNGYLALTINADNSVTHKNYDSFGRVVDVTEFESLLSKSIRSEVALRDINSLAHTDLIDKIMGDLASGISGVDNPDRLTAYKWNIHGELLEERKHNITYHNANMAQGDVSQFVGDIVTKFEYDLNGNVTNKKVMSVIPGTYEEKIHSNFSEEIQYEYDAINRRVKEIRPSYLGLAGLTQTPTSSLGYDEFGNITKEAMGDANANKAQYSHYINGQLQDEHGYRGVTEYGYDNNGNINEIIDRISASRTILTYDDNNNETSRTIHGLGSNILLDKRSQGFNRYGELITKGRNDIDVVFNQYNDFGKIEKSNADGAYSFYLYDKSGNVTMQIRSAAIDMSDMSIEDVLTLSQTSASNFMVTLYDYDEMNREVAQYDVDMEKVYNYIRHNDLQPLEKPPVFTHNLGHGLVANQGLNLTMSAHLVANENFENISSGGPGTLTHFSADESLEVHKHKSITLKWDSIPNYYGDFKIVFNTDYHYGSDTSYAPLADIFKYYKGEHIVSSASRQLVIDTNIDLPKIHYKDVGKVVYDYQIQIFKKDDTDSWVEVMASAGIYKWEGGYPRRKDIEDVHSTPTKTFKSVTTFMLDGQSPDTARIKFYYRPEGSSDNYLTQDAGYVDSNAWSIDYSQLDTTNLAAGQRFEYYYVAEDAQGRQVNKIGGVISVVPGQEGGTHDTLEADPQPVTSLQAMLANGWIYQGSAASTVKYDRFANVISETSGLGNRVISAGYILENTVDVGFGREQSHTTHFNYNKLNQLTEKAEAHAGYVDTNGNRIETYDVEYQQAKESFYYDHLGKLVAKRDALGNLTRQSWSAGNIASTMDALGNTRTQEYDALGDLRASTSAGNSINDDGIANAVKTYTDYDYSTEGYITQSSYGDGIEGTVTRHYEADGDLLTQTKQKVSTASDGSQTIGETLTETRSYDGLGRVTSIIDAADAETKFSYKALGSGEIVTKKIVYDYTINNNGNTLEDWTDYFGRVTKHKDLMQDHTHYSYNQLGLKENEYREEVKLDSDLWISTSVTKNIHYRYNERNQVTGVYDLGTNRFADYEYDANGNRIREALSGIGQQGALEFYQDVNASYDAQGRVTQIKDKENN
ncbi:MAG: hypothetical protein RPR28_01865, partial [Cycloclasticus sp.]